MVARFAGHPDDGQEMGPRPGVGLAQLALDMLLDGAGGHAQGRDLLVGEPPRHEAKDIGLPCRAEPPGREARSRTSRDSPMRSVAPADVAPGSAAHLLAFGVGERGTMAPIVVGMDGSAGATAALRWAAGLARRLGSDLVVTAATVVGPTGAEAPDVLERRLEQEWCRAADEAGVTYRTLVVDGDPRRSLLEAAATEGADLIVVGSNGLGWFPAMHLGSVAHHLAQHTDRPLAVVPADVADFDAGRVLVGVDGSAGSAAAVDWGGALIRALGGSAIALHDDLPASPRLPTADPETRRLQAEEECAAWTAGLGTDGIVERIVVSDGDPARAIAQTARDRGVPLIVLGTRGAGGFHGLRLGSVALKLLHHAAVPVVLVPPPGGTSAPDS